MAEVRWDGVSVARGAGSEVGCHDPMKFVRDGHPVFGGEVQLGLQPVELGLQMSALAQDDGPRPFHQFAHFRQPGFRQTSTAQFRSECGRALVPQKLGPCEFSRAYCLANGFKREFWHERYLYIWSAVCCAANRLLKYEDCCSMEAISASETAI